MRWSSFISSPLSHNPLKNSTHNQGRSSCSPGTLEASFSSIHMIWIAPLTFSFIFSPCLRETASMASLGVCNAFQSRSSLWIPSVSTLRGKGLGGCLGPLEAPGFETPWVLCHKSISRWMVEEGPPRWRESKQPLWLTPPKPTLIYLSTCCMGHQSSQALQG